MAWQAGHWRLLAIIQDVYDPVALYIDISFGGEARSWLRHSACCAQKGQRGGEKQKRRMTNVQLGEKAGSG